MVLDFSVEKAAGSVILAHSISGIVNEIISQEEFFGIFRLHIHFFGLELNTVKCDGQNGTISAVYISV